MKSRMEQIFKENIEIPEIVQRKVEETFLAIRKEETETMKEKKYVKRGTFIMNSKRKAVLVICICTLLLLATSMYGLFGRDDTGIVDSTQTPESGNMLQAVQDLFTVKVYAAGIPDDSGDGYVPLGTSEYIPLSFDGGAVAYMLSSIEDGGVSYCINTGFLCEGENIEHITYSINKGTFQIVEPKDSTIVKDGEKYEDNLITGSVGGEEVAENGESLSVLNNYKSFTVSYDNQINDQTSINICGNTNESWDELFGEKPTLEGKVAGLEKMLKDVVITCTVQYEDGSVAESQITMGGGTIKSGENGVGEIPEQEVILATVVFRLQE